MTVRRNRAVAGIVAAVLGLFGLFAAAPGLSILGSASEVCLRVNPAESLIGTQLHLLSSDGACPHGTLAPGPALATAVGVSVVVSVSVLLAGLVSLLLAVGFGLAVRRTLRRARGWWRRRLIPALLGGIVRPDVVPVPVRVDGRRAQRVHSPRQLRGPPSC